MVKLRDMCFKKTDHGNIENGLNSDTLALLNAFDGRTPFFQIQQAARLPRTVFKESFLELYQKKLIKEVSKAPRPLSTKEEYLGDSILDDLRTAAVQVAGPIGELLVSDALEHLKLQPSTIPVSQLPNLVKIIAEDIPGEKQRKRFMEQIPR